MITQYPESGKLTLAESLAVLYYEKDLTFSTYKTLAEWLGCYRYILPAQRSLSPEIFSLPTKPNPASLYKLYHYSLIIDSILNTTQQSNVVRYIKCNQLIRQAQLVSAKPLSELIRDFKTYRIPH